MDDTYENIDEYNPNKKCKMLIVFNDRIVGVLSNKKLEPIVTYYLSSTKNKYFYCLYLYLCLYFYCLFAVPKILD